MVLLILVDQIVLKNVLNNSDIIKILIIFVLRNVPQNSKGGKPLTIKSININLN